MSAVAGNTKHAASAPAKQVSLHFTTHSDRPFPSPLARVTIAGQPSSMIVDTGSTDIVLSQSIVQRLNLKVSTKRGGGVDGVGRHVPVAQLSAPYIIVNGWGRVAHTRVVVTALPGVFKRLGISGVISPQRLAPPGESVVINLATRRLFLLPSARAQTYVAHQGWSKSLPVVCHNVDGTCLYSVAARINGQSVRLLLDTGASNTGIVAGSQAGRKLIPDSQLSDNTHYVASGKVTTHALQYAKLSVGSTTSTIKVLISPGSSAEHNGIDGRLGMNFLRRCTLVLGHTGGVLACK